MFQNHIITKFYPNDNIIQTIVRTKLTCKLTRLTFVLYYFCVLFRLSLGYLITNEITEIFANWQDYHVLKS